MNPLVSIIIPTYNRAHLIGETLDSVLAQTYTNWECIIIDDGSTDDTETVIVNYIKKDSRFQFYKRPANKRKGANSCRNYGFDIAEGDIIQWLDSDDLLAEFALELYIIEFNKSPNIDVVVAKLQMVDMVSDLIIKENSIISENLIEDYFVGKVTYYISGPFWRSKFLKEQNYLFDESIGNLDDWDFNLRMLYQNPEIVYIERPLIEYRIHQSSLSHEIGKLNIIEVNSELFAREKHLKLIEQNKKANPYILKVYVKDRCKYFFREAMVKKDANRLYYFKLLIKKQLILNNYIGIIKTIFGFTFFILFNKGYKFLK